MVNFITIVVAMIQSFKVLKCTPGSRIEKMEVIGVSILAKCYLILNIVVNNDEHNVCTTYCYCRWCDDVMLMDDVGSMTWMMMMLLLNLSSSI